MFAYFYLIVSNTDEMTYLKWIEAWGGVGPFQLLNILSLRT